MIPPDFQPRAVVIGASAGAIHALAQILPELPANFPMPVLIVVHIPTQTRNTLAELFVAKCRLRVKEAEDKEIAQAGTIYFAPPNYHLLVETDGTLSLSNEEPELFSRPAINVLFESAADAFGSDLIGIVLTGANEDGAHGLHNICEEGGVALVQNPAEAEARIMPQAAIAACKQAQVMSLTEIVTFLRQWPSPTN